MASMRRLLIWTLLALHRIHSAGAQDDVPPYFKTEPVRTQVHLEGNRLVLTCMAEGSWPLEFKWLHNNRELTRFSLEYSIQESGDCCEMKKSTKSIWNTDGAIIGKVTMVMAVVERMMVTMMG
ncbi:protein sidekick-2-like [Phodopus roborovskii]|uniref:protein sidekick-2-like n=1 Tax=Phodopus roborovskii TaxID=109678 RepID=UPI0021E45674|nr:protein sidekick-2-like [Phodopus roborovskii]